jgi:protein gp37
MSLKESIGWCDITRNPIKGRCKGGCWYCYYSGNRGILNRFKHDPTIRFKPSVLFDLPKSPKKVFLCSTHDLFGSWIPKSWRDILFDIWIPNNSQHIFQILTKFPENIDRAMPDNVWLGVTVTKWAETGKLKELRKKEARIKFVSYEPLLDNCMPFFPSDNWLDWAIIGRLTGYGHKYDPYRNQIEYFVREISWRFRIPIFLKDNLKDIWGKPLIQEMPE